MELGRITVVLVLMWGWQKSSDRMVVHMGLRAGLFLCGCEKSRARLGIITVVRPLAAW